MIRYVKRTTFFLLYILASGCAGGPEPPPVNAIPKPVPEVVTTEDIRYLFAEMRGSYDQHPNKIAEIASYLRSREIPYGRCIGIYFDDPDAVAEPDLRWQIGFELLDDADYRGKGLKIRILPGGRTVRVESNVAHLASHGLYSEVWFLERNYVQVRPSRTVYHLGSEDPLETRVTILYPVIARSREIPILTRSTL